MTVDTVYNSVLLSAPLLLHSTGQIIRSPASVSVSVCLLSLLRLRFWREFDETKSFMVWKL